MKKKVFSTYNCQIMLNGY